MIKETFSGKLAHYMKAVDEVISDLDSRMMPELVAFNSVKEICASLTPLRSAEALEQRSILLTASVVLSVGAAHAVTLRGGSM